MTEQEIAIKNAERRADCTATLSPWDAADYIIALAELNPKQAGLVAFIMGERAASQKCEIERDWYARFKTQLIERASEPTAA